ncbi:hypothetical protein JCM6882_001924 [Rhodosporidiobolus microsporus]
MLRTVVALTLGVLLAGSAAAAPAACAAGKYLDSATGTCKPCARGVKTCTSASVATSCVPRYYLTADARTEQHCLGGGRCYPFAVLKSTTYCDKSASTCTVDGTTLGCAAPYFLNATAPAGNDAPAAGGDAAAPSERAVPIGGTCVSAGGCGYAFYANSTTRACTPCGEGESHCTEAGADACNYGYFLSEGKCVETCPEGQVPDHDELTCVVDETACPEGQFYDSYSKSCVDTCRDTAIVQDGAILPALFGDVGSMTCVPCNGGNVYRCNPNTGYARNCYASYAGPRGQLPLESDSTSTTCSTAEVCSSYGGLGLYKPLKSFTLPEEFAAVLPEGDNFIGYCPGAQK